MWFKLLISLLMTITISSTGYADCIKFNIEEALKNDEAIFAGKVIKIQPQAIKNDDGMSYDLVLFEVESIWKGITESQVVVQNESQYDNVFSSNNFKFEVGERYLVYTYKWKSPYLQTNYCKGTKLLSNAGEDLNFLGEGKKPIGK